jgi:ABC-type transport system involved in cytochrome c biogenesis permease subunit
MKAMMIIIIYAVVFSYLAAALLYFWGAKQAPWLKAAFVLAVLGCLCHFAALVLRTLLAGMLPLTNGPEFLLSFTWFTVLMYLLLTLRYPLKSAGGVVMIISALLVSLVAFLMREQLGTVAPLMPALKSPWLTVHVITAALSYAAFTLAAGLAVMQFFPAGRAIGDDHLYLLVGGGFALLSLSIVLGAVWAEQAWGRYWSWDPKETWALVTWIIYALYLHLYRSREWRGHNARLMLIAGFILVLFTFFGVNYLLPGLHSYA